MVRSSEFEQDAREAIRHGERKLTQAVGITLGPRGRTVLLAKEHGAPTVTKGGATVANEIKLKDPLENIGAKMVRQVASKTNEVAGDGTTTATVLASAIFNEGLRAVTSGINPICLKNGIEKATYDVVEKKARFEDALSAAVYLLIFDENACAYRLAEVSATF